MADLCEPDYLRIELASGALNLEELVPVVACSFAGSFLCSKACFIIC